MLRILPRLLVIMSGKDAFGVSWFILLFGFGKCEFLFKSRSYENYKYNYVSTEFWCICAYVSTMFSICICRWIRYSPVSVSIISAFVHHGFCQMDGYHLWLMILPLNLFLNAHEVRDGELKCKAWNWEVVTPVRLLFFPITNNQMLELAEKWLQIATLLCITIFYFILIASKDVFSNTS